MTVKIACGQMCSLSSLSNNARVIKKLIHKAIAQKVEVLFLPEASDYISRDAKHSYQLAQNTHSKFLKTIQNELVSANTLLSSKLRLAIGIHEPSLDAASEKVRNTQVWIDEKGDIVHRYQKLHLFDINIPNGPILKESNSVEPGMEILPPFSIGESPFTVGFAICYDIRFPELSLRLRKLGASILTYPSAFTTRTGEAHWLELGRARAIDSQCYVVMAAQCGNHDTNADIEDGTNPKKRVSYGQSVIIDPWGKVLALGKKFDEISETDNDNDGDYYELITADLDYDYLTKIRTDLPVFTHRRPEIFGYEV